MASVSTGIELDGISSVQSAEMSGNGDDQNIQLNLANVERDSLAITREKRLLMMVRCSILTAIVSVVAIVIGLLAILTSDSLPPYSLGGGIIAGGMALLMTICPFCMFLEGKKTITGTKMTGLFKCNLICMVVWFSFTICGIFIALGIPGIWGMLECIVEKQKPNLNFRNICADQTSEKLKFSVLTVVLSAILLILTIVINCLFCCNPKAFGYKTITQRRYESYSDMIRREEEAERRTNERRGQARELDEYESNRTNRQQEYTREAHNYFAENEREYSREPNAPPLEDNAMYGNNRSQQDRRPPRRFQQDRGKTGGPYKERYNPQRSPGDNRHHPHSGNDNYRHHPDHDRSYPRSGPDGDRRYPRRPEDDRRHPRRPEDERNRSFASNENEDRYRPGRSREYDNRRNRHESNNSGTTHGQTSRYVNQRDENEKERNLENDNEAPPPSYDEVVSKYFKADDV